MTIALTFFNNFAAVTFFYGGGGDAATMKKAMPTSCHHLFLFFGPFDLVH
jgi:hypothetical protein